MKLSDLKCVSVNVNLDDYYELYDYVRSQMDNPSWLGVIPREETEEILKDKGKIWLYYDKDIKVCSIFYMPSSEKSLKKYGIDVDYQTCSALGPVMVSPDYIGNGLMSQMMDVFNQYNIEVGNTHIFTKAQAFNTASTHNILKDGYELVNQFENDRGLNNVYIKKLVKKN